MKVRPECGIISATQHPKGQTGLDNIKKADTEASIKLAAAEEPEVSAPGMKPTFTVTLPAEVTVGEDCKLHLECNVEPKSDTGLKIAWYHNGLPLSSGSRIQATHDFGLVTLDIKDVGARDQVCKSQQKNLINSYLAQGVNIINLCTSFTNSHNFTTL